MTKITFMGAGSTIFARNIIGDSMLSPALCDAHFALYDIDRTRLRESKKMLDTINANSNQGRAKITAHHGVKTRKTALKNAQFVVNAIQVGGYEPATVIDFEIPKKYGLRQTIADTLGIGGIFRALRTIPVMLDFAADMQQVCPDAWLLNYSNPMAMLMGGIFHGSNVKAVGLCHSVQVCASGLLKMLGFDLNPDEVKWHIAGINHMAWLLEISHNGKDLYPQIKKRADAAIKKVHQLGVDKVIEAGKDAPEDSPEKQLYWVAGDMIRLEMMRHFGYYITESSEHNAEYAPYWIKSQYPELIEKYNIPLDEYPRRCVRQIDRWKQMSKQLLSDAKLSHEHRGHEYGSYIMEAVVTDKPFRIYGNVVNNGLIRNLPDNAIVEVPCMVDRNGVQPCQVGTLPEQLAAMNRTNINVQLLTVQAALTRSRDAVYHAAYMDPHTAAELPLDKIRNLCDDLIQAHGEMIPKLK